MAATWGWAGTEVLWETALTEYIGHDWKGEMVRYRATTAQPLPPECHLVAADPTGRTVGVPCQIRPVAGRAPQESSAYDLYCLLDLAPYQTLKLQLLKGEGNPETGAPLPVATDEKTLTVSSRMLDIHVPVSISDGKGLAEAQIPLPLLRMRNPEPKTWIGAGAFEHVGELLSLETRVVDCGPVFVDVEAAYRFAKGEYTATLRVIRDQPVVLWREEFRHEDPRAALLWECSAGMPLKAAVWDYATWSAFPARVKGAGLGSPKVFPLEFDRAPAPVNFQPWVHWGNADVTTWLELWPSLPSAGPVSFEKPSLDERARGEKTLGLPEGPPPREWAVGIFMGNPLDWNPADQNGYRASMPRLELTRRQQVLLRLPLRNGQRTFGLSVAERTPDRYIGQSWNVGRVPDTEARQIKYGETALDDVKDYVLDYDQDLPDSFPRLFLTETERARYASSLSTNVPFHDRVQSARNACRSALEHPRFKPLFDQSLSWSLADTPLGEVSDDNLVAAALAATDDGLDPLLQVQALEASKRIAFHFFRHYTGPGMGIAPHNWLSTEYGMSTVDVASRHLTPEQFRRVRARLLFAAYKFGSDNYWCPRLGFSGTANMTAMVNGFRGNIALLYPHHPRFTDWLTAAETEVRRELTEWMGPTGGWVEPPHYMTVSMDAIIGLGYGLANAGRSEVLYGDPLKKTMLWLAKISTPRDPRFGNRRHFPEIGHTYVMETSVHFTFMSKIHRERDPAYADGMQWLWYEMGCPMWPGIGGACPFTAGYREALTDLSPRPSSPPAWRSEHFPGSGVVLRGHFPDDRESYLYLIQGNMHQHYDNDQGSFMMWGKGRPLCLDWGYHGLMPAWLHNRMDIGGGGEIAEFSGLERADYLHNHQGDWDRQILFVKDADPLGPNYFLIRDSTSGRGTNNWWLWINTEQPIPAGGSLVSATGRDDVDLDIWFDAASAGLLKRIRQAAPEPASFAGPATDLTDSPGGKADIEPFDRETRPWVYETTEHTETVVIGRGGRYWGNEKGTTQQGLNLRVPNGQPVVALLYPRLNQEAKPVVTSFSEDRALKVVSAAGTDYVFLGLEPFEAAVEGVGFKGKGGVVQERASEAVLSLAAPGEIRFGRYGLSAGSAAGLRVKTKALTVELPDGFAGGEITVTAPRGFTLGKPAVGVKLLREKGGRYALTVPAGATSVMLEK